MELKTSLISNFLSTGLVTENQHLPKFLTDAEFDSLQQSVGLGPPSWWLDPIFAADDKFSCDGTTSLEEIFTKEDDLAFLSWRKEACYFLHDVDDAPMCLLDRLLELERLRTPTIYPKFTSNDADQSSLHSSGPDDSERSGMDVGRTNSMESLEIVEANSPAKTTSDADDHSFNRTGDVFGLTFDADAVSSESEAIISCEPVESSPKINFLTNILHTDPINVAVSSESAQTHEPNFETSFHHEEQLRNIEGYNFSNLSQFSTESYEGISFALPSSISPVPEVSLETLPFTSSPIIRSTNLTLSERSFLLSGGSTTIIPVEDGEAVFNSPEEFLHSSPQQKISANRSKIITSTSMLDIFHITACSSMRNVSNFPSSVEVVREAVINEAGWQGSSEMCSKLESSISNRVLSDSNLHRLVTGPKDELGLDRNCESVVNRNLCGNSESFSLSLDNVRAAFVTTQPTSKLSNFGAKRTSLSVSLEDCSLSQELQRNCPRILSTLASSHSKDWRRFGFPIRKQLANSKSLEKSDKNPLAQPSLFISVSAPPPSNSVFPTENRFSRTKRVRSNFVNHLAGPKPLENSFRNAPTNMNKSIRPPVHNSTLRMQVPKLPSSLYDPVPVNLKFSPNTLSISRQRAPSCVSASQASKKLYGNVTANVKTPATSHFPRYNITTARLQNSRLPIKSVTSNFTSIFQRVSEQFARNNIPKGSARS